MSSEESPPAMYIKNNKSAFQEARGKKSLLSASGG